MQAYGETMAMAYDTIWGGYADRAGREILNHVRTTGREGAPVLDVCCGAGQLAEIFLREGFSVTGIDLSESMLEKARQRCGSYVETERARFECHDASKFEVPGKYGLIVSTYDALNHLESITALESCFHCVRRAALPGAVFIFDLTTVKGLEEWNRITVTDKDHASVITRGMFDRESGRARKKFTGFLKLPSGLYQRFEETIFAVAHPVDAVRKALARAGFTGVRTSLLTNLGRELENPESEDRIMFVAEAGTAQGARA